MKIHEMIDEIKMSNLDKDLGDLERGMGKGIDPADKDDLDPDFKQAPMIMQVGKVLDSRGNPNPVKHLTTDDGEKHPVKPEQAATIKMLLTTDKVKPDVKRKFTMDVQKADTLGPLLAAGSNEEMIKVFLKKYQPSAPERSNYA